MNRIGFLNWLNKHNINLVIDFKLNKDKKLLEMGTGGLVYNVYVVMNEWMNEWAYERAWGCWGHKWKQGDHGEQWYIYGSQQLASCASFGSWKKFYLLPKY